MDASVIERVAARLSWIVHEGRLPQKLLIVHRFTRDMIVGEERLRVHPGVAVAVNVDGFGDRPNKVSKYREFARPVNGPSATGSSSSTRRTRT